MALLTIAFHKWVFDGIGKRIRGEVDLFKEINESIEWHPGIFYTLSGSYAILASIALIQLVRIQMRVPEYSWSTQKVFHFMNFLVNGSRAILFGFYKSIYLLKPHVLEMILMDLPSLIFFSTYTLLVLFWAEIYYQARNLSTNKLRPTYLTINGMIYLFQACIWLYVRISHKPIAVEVAKLFLSVVSFVGALGFMIYGGRLFCMLRRFPIESKGRRNKLTEALEITEARQGLLAILSALFTTLRRIESLAFFIAAPCAFSLWALGSLVGSVTAICCSCFMIRFFMVMVSAFQMKAELYVANHYILNFFYYLLVEIVPSSLVLYILRKLPPKRISNQYHPIR